MTGHKAQGVTTGRTFVIVNGATEREWAYVAMSRGRQANTLYLANPGPAEEACTHLTRPDQKEALDALTASLGRSSAHAAAIDQLTGSGPASSDVLERVAWIVARRQAEHDHLEHQQSGIGVAVGR